MRVIKTLILILMIAIAVNLSYAFQANSSNFKLSTGTVSSGGDKVNSSSYKNYVATGIIGGTVNSSTYKNSLGFFYTWLLADNQPCTSANQCQGGFCCSNLCKSNSCPVAPEEAAVAGGGAAAVGGGGGGLIPRKEEKDYSLSKGSIKIKLTLGESVKETLTIKNTGKAAISVSLDIEGVKDYLSLSDDSVDLEADEDITIILDFIGRNVGGFAGRIVAIGDGITKTIPIILEVITELVLFDVKLDIPAENAEVEPGDELKTQITLLNVGAPERVDVFATYFIKDLRGNIVHEESETFAVEKQISYPKVFRIHESTEPGSYVVVIEIRYVDSFAVSSQLFRVVEKKGLVITDILAKNASLMMFLAFILIVVISLLSYKLVGIIKMSKKKKIKKLK